VPAHSSIAACNGPEPARGTTKRKKAHPAGDAPLHCGANHAEAIELTDISVMPPAALLLVRGLPGRGRLGGSGISNGLIDDPVKILVNAQNFGVTRPLATSGHDENGGCVVNADALAEFLVGLDCGCKLALRVNGEGQRKMVAGGKLRGELAQHAGADDGALIGKDSVAILVTQGLAVEVEPAGIDRSRNAPSVIGKRKVMANPGNLVSGRGRFDDGIMCATERAFKVRKLDDGHTSTGWRPEGRGVMHLGFRRAKLGVDTGGSDKKRDRGEAEQKAAPHPKNGKSTGKGKRMRHSG